MSGANGSGGGADDHSNWNVLNREALQLRTRNEIPSLPLLAIRGHICFRCFSPAEKMTKCGGCKRAHYCGKDCQTKDWRLQHKLDCKIFRRINDVERQETATSRPYELWAESLYGKISMLQEMTRDPTPLNIIQCQAHCSTCNRSSMQLPPGINLVPCSTCYLVHTCSSCTSTHSSEDCKKYQLIGSIEMFRIAHFNTSGRVSSQAPTAEPRSHYRALKTAQNWYEYFMEISDKRDAVQNIIKPDFTLNERALALADLETQSSIQRMWLFLLTSTETQTMPLTLLAALEDIMDDLSTRETLTIHFVGAGWKEVQNSVVFEELLHLIPSLKTLRLTFVGTTCYNKDDPHGTAHELVTECCPVCTAQGRKRIIALHRGLYHDFAEIHWYQKPDLAVLFHSGRSQCEDESWAPTIRLLVDSKTPTLCTTYTEREAREEISELEALGARLIKGAEVNRFKSLVPILEPLEGADHTFYYHNYYRYIFKGR